MNTRTAPLKPPLRPKIGLTPVESSSIKAIGHDPKSNTLRVEFHSGGVYDYPGVTAAEHDSIVKAESIGQHFIKHIRHREFVKVPQLKTA